MVCNIELAQQGITTVDIANIIEGITTVPAEELPAIRDRLVNWAWTLRDDMEGREAVLDAIAFLDREMERRPASPALAVAARFREF